MARATDYLNVHCHYYMTRCLAYMFRVLQMLGHVSHFNLVNWYNMIFVDDTPKTSFKPGQLFTASMSEEVCRHGLMLHSLMKHADRRGTQLIVASNGPDNIRFETAIESHLDLLQIEGTKYRDHFCSSCVKLLTEVDPHTGEVFHKTIRAVVTDGLTIGHWRCSASAAQLEEIAESLGLPMPAGPGTRKLANINDRFCPDHYVLLGNRCRAQPCVNITLPGTEVCAEPDHIKVWSAFNQHIKGNFSLTQILN